MDQYIGEVRMFVGNYAPDGWALCNGELLNINENDTLFSLIGKTYGGDGITNFALPDLRGRIPIHQGQTVGGRNHIVGQNGGTEEVTLTNDHLPVHSHYITATSAEGTQASPEGAYPSNKIAQYTQETTDLSHMNADLVSYEGGNQPHDNMMPYLAINYIISLSGDYPAPDEYFNNQEHIQTEGTLGEIRLFPFPFAPKGWAFCNGQIIPVPQNQALFSLLGTMYGGNGTTNFALPDLRGRVPIHSEAGQSGGVEDEWLTIKEMPHHTHTFSASTTISDKREAVGNALANDLRMPYEKNLSSNVKMNHKTLSYSGEGQTHNNMQPYTVLNFCIATQGYYPTRN